jgi:two-component sensor histidine kinase
MGSLVRSTGVKMFLILTLALLPLGIIALLASLQAIRTADMEKEALLRVAVSQSARKLTAQIRSDTTAMALTANAFATASADPGMCGRLTTFLKPTRGEAGFAIHDRAGNRLCASQTGTNDALPADQRFDTSPVALLPAPGVLAIRVFSDNRRVVALRYYDRRSLESVTDPATALQNREIALMRDGQSLLVSRSASPLGASHRSLTAQVTPYGLTLQLTVRDPPPTLSRRLTLFLPLLMWFAAAAIGWFVVNRLLIRPLVLLRRAVAAYKPGEVLEPLRRVRTPAQEISALGDTFRAISEDVATHEAEMAESLARQTKLTREVHHRVKNNLQIIASLISLHARAAHEPEAIDAYASIQRRVDALSVVHRNHFAELEENRGVGVRSLISELSASLRGTAPAAARRFGIQIQCDNLHITQDVAVPVAFLVTELVELAMLADPTASMRISAQADPERQDRAILAVSSPALRDATVENAHLYDRFSRVLTGLSRQLRAPLEHDGEAGLYSIAITVVP